MRKRLERGSEKEMKSTTGYPQIVIQKLTVTPAMAKSWLEQGNINYRTPNEATIEGFTRAMVSGEWKLTPQGISIDTDGLILDGQHRLHAIIRSNMSVQMFVAFNVPREIELVIDGGKARRFKDHARYLGLSYNEQALALAKIMNNPKSLTYNPIRYQPFEQLELVNRFIEGIDFVLKYKARYSKSPALAPIAMAYYYPEYQERLPRFLELFNTGKSADPRESAPIALRDIVLMREEKSPARLFAKAQAAVYAFNRSTPLSKLYARGFNDETGSLVDIFFPLKMNTNGKIVPNK
jgi:hypothetical protein